ATSQVFFLLPMADLHSKKQMVRSLNASPLRTSSSAGPQLLPPGLPSQTSEMARQPLLSQHPATMHSLSQHPDPWVQPMLNLCGLVPLEQVISYSQEEAVRMTRSSSQDTQQACCTLTQMEDSPLLLWSS